MPSLIEIEKLPVALNVCQQELREVWGAKDHEVSIAHVIMQPKAESLLHEHHKMVEIYIVLDGKGILSVGARKYPVKKNTLMEIPTYTPHKLKNIGNKTLTHLVLAIPGFDPSDVFVLENQ